MAKGRSSARKNKRKQISYIRSGKNKKSVNKSTANEDQKQTG